MSISLRRSPRRWLVLASLMLSGLVSAAEPVVRIGTGDWVPYVDQHRADGGALARLISAVFAAAGYQVEFSFYPWDRNVLMLQQGELDAIMPYSCSPMRLNYGVCSEPLVRGEIVLFHRKDQAFDWQRIDDLRGWRVGGTAGYSYGDEWDQAVREGKLKVDEVTTDEQNIRKLLLRRVDVIAMEVDVARHLMRKLLSQEEAAMITQHPKLVMQTPICLALSRQSARSPELLTRFNRGLQRLTESGAYERYLQELHTGVRR